METLLIIYLISIVFGGLFCYALIDDLKEVRIMDLFVCWLAIMPMFNTILGMVWIVIKLDELYDIDAKLNTVIWRKK